MTSEQKLAAICALDPYAALHMRRPGDWYLPARLELKRSDGDGVLSSVCGNGADPYAAIDDCWEKLTTGHTATGYVVVRAMQPDRRHVRWNGFMWEDVSAVYPVGAR